MSERLEEMKYTYQVKVIPAIQIAPDGSETFFIRKEDADYLIQQVEKSEHLEQDLEAEQTLRMLHERKVRQLEGRIEDALETLQNCDGADLGHTNEAVDEAINELLGRI